MPYLRTPVTVNDAEVTLVTPSTATDAFSEQIRNNWKPDTHTFIAVRLLTEDDLFLDLGANIGAFCIPVAKLTGARCLAVEALASNIASLQLAIDDNGLDEKVRWVQAAITDQDDVIRMSGLSAYGTVSTTGKGLRSLSYSLDGLMQEFDLGEVSLVKMDIEGCEKMALEGGTQFFDSNPNASIIFEANGAHCYSSGYSPQWLIEFLERRNYFVYMVHGGRLIKRTSKDFQEFGLTNYIASPKMLEDSFSDYSFQDFSEDVKLKSVERALTIMKKGYQLFMADQMHLAPAYIRESAEINELVAKLQRERDA